MEFFSYFLFWLCINSFYKHNWFLCDGFVSVTLLNFFVNSDICFNPHRSLSTSAYRIISTAVILFLLFALYAFKFFFLLNWSGWHPIIQWIRMVLVSTLALFLSLERSFQLFSYWPQNKMLDKGFSWLPFIFLS